MGGGAEKWQDAREHPSNAEGLKSSHSSTSSPAVRDGTVRRGPRWG
jgi:hypothetical protein